MLIKIPKGWEIPEQEATPEPVYLSRRKFLTHAGLTGVWAVGVLPGWLRWLDPRRPEVKPLEAWPLTDAERAVYPATRNPAFVLDRQLTDEVTAARFNNYYEFSGHKDDVWQKVASLPTRPWTVEVAGLVERPQTMDIDALIRRMPMEERLYRLRCVEAWAMAVPWTGFPMKALVEMVRPLSKARYVRLVSKSQPRGENLLAFNAPWPYTEGLTMAEAMNPLTMLVTGIYGHPLPNQHGAPLRLIVPWKYGFKSIKTIVKIEFTDQQPATFWNTVGPDEYDFRANVNPDVPHPRWSQATEKMIGTGERRTTILYNGYGQYVAGLYA